MGDSGYTSDGRNEAILGTPQSAWPSFPAISSGYMLRFFTDAIRRIPLVLLRGAWDWHQYWTLLRVARTVFVTTKLLGHLLLGSLT
jgi:hypothetical protein